MDAYDLERDKQWYNTRLEVETATQETVENNGSVYVTERWWWRLSVRPEGLANKIRGGDGGGDEGKICKFYYV